MARTPRQHGGDENGAWHKLTEALRHAQEAATEIGFWRSDDARWNAFAMILQRLEQGIQKLRTASRRGAGDTLEEMLRRNGLQ